LTEHLAFLQPYLKVGDTSGNLDIEDTTTEESNTSQNYGSETLVDREMPDESSSMQLIEKRARKSLRQTHKKNKREKKQRGEDYPDYNNIYE
jgi:hypothetical protein